MKNPLKSITNLYNKLSNFGKILILISLLLIIIVFFKYVHQMSPYNNTKREGFQQTKDFLFKKGIEIYDDFYANIYDFLVFNEMKNDYEVGLILNQNVPNVKSVILDVGSGTGHHVAKMAENKNLEVVGIDISPSMIKKAKENYPNLNFQQADVLNKDVFNNNTFTHILCLYFTLYYIEDKASFFNNCMDWLMPGGYLVVHLVDRYKFDPILPPGNPLFIVSPQKYAKERITKTKVNFNEFIYNADFKLDETSDTAIFDEKFKFNDGKVRKQEHILYMNNLSDIVNMAQDAGFLLHAKIDLVKVAYEYQYLYVFMKPG
uniref:Methyltransferase domain-containing protein n=1 Tax=viral metagenome TaxID=1070528 RepID=A0A6C0JFE1_9ZZZZ